ncbi:hypothetical protein EVAR_36492_1 [Eumeta japonica]|uniref:Uncharacterized protein n=1 Tax=Eumeta variegata TaxID=151549 RepID=A0A4C1WS07_EUMVA|nr:hypothetical protein EVAR_36492_1 [Eumeta japonica]
MRLRTKNNKNCFPRGRTRGEHGRYNGRSASNTRPDSGFGNGTDTENENATGIVTDNGEYYRGRDHERRRALSMWKTKEYIIQPRNRSRKRKPFKVRHPFLNLFPSSLAIDAIRLRTGPAGVALALLLTTHEEILSQKPCTWTTKAFRKV